MATKWHSVTGGDDGLSITRPDLNLGFTSISLASLTNFYYLTLIVVGAAIVFCWYFTQTAMGKTVLLMRENEERMKFLGYNTNISRLILFTFTGAMAGLAGSFYTLHFQFVSISAISVDMTTAVLLMTFVGGTKTFWGPILGAFVYIYLAELSERYYGSLAAFHGIHLHFHGSVHSRRPVRSHYGHPAAAFFGKKDNNGGKSAAAEEVTS